MSTKTISMQTAHRIWSAHREIQAATKLLDDLRGKLAAGENPTPLDGFGRPRGYQLGTPIEHGGHRLYDVGPLLAARMIEAHIADKEREVAEASQAAMQEMGGLIQPVSLGVPPYPGGIRRRIAGEDYGC